MEDETVRKGPRCYHVSELQRDKLEALAAARMDPRHDHLNVLMEDEPIFDAKDRFVLRDGRVVYTGPCPFDAPDRATINGRVVVVEGCRYRVVRHQTHATVRGPGKGDEVGLVLEPMPEDSDIPPPPVDEGWPDAPAG